MKTYRVEVVQTNVFYEFAESEEAAEESNFLEDELSSLDPDRMTAREALDLIYRWKEKTNN